MASKRWIEIDGLKAIGIVTVVLIHSIQYQLLSETPLEKFLGTLTRFAVPSFFFIFGFLFNKSSRSIKELVHKLVLRLIPPYLIASTLMLYLRWTFPWIESTPLQLSLLEILKIFFFGSALGIYYFLFVLLYLSLLGLLLRKLKDAWIIAFFFFSVGAILAFYYHPYGLPTSETHFFFVLFRHPALHLWPFLLGWIFSKKIVHDDSWIHGFVTKKQPLLLTCIMIFDGITLCYILKFQDPAIQKTLFQYFTIQQSLLQLHSFWMLLILWKIGSCWKLIERAITWVSLRSYSIFLFHLPLIRMMQRLLEPIHGKAPLLWIFSSCSIGLIITMILVWLGNRVLGRHSKWVIGG